MDNRWVEILDARELAVLVPPEASQLSDDPDKAIRQIAKQLESRGLLMPSSGRIAKKRPAKIISAKKAAKKTVEGFKKAGKKIDQKIQ